MKKIVIISFLTLWMGNYLPVNAQYNIKVTLSKGTGEKGKDICLTITNNNPEDIGIFSYARWLEHYSASYEVQPWSYARLIGWKEALSDGFPKNMNRRNWSYPIRYTK